MALNGFQAAWNGSFMANSSGLSFKDERQNADAMFEENLENVLTPRLDAEVEDSSGTESLLPTRTHAQVKSYSRVDLEEELMRVQLERDDLHDRLLREREVKSLEAKQWEKRAVHTQELLISERRARAELEEKVRELEQRLSVSTSTRQAIQPSVGTPRTFAVENGMVLTETAERFTLDGSSALQWHIPLDELQAQAPATPRQTPRTTVESSPARSPGGELLGGAGRQAVAAGKVASLIGSFNPPLEGSGTRAPASSAQSTPRRAQSQPPGPPTASPRRAGSVLAQTPPSARAFTSERLVRIPRGEGGGVGLRFGVTKEGRVLVTEVMPGATAQRFGQVRVCDELLDVDAVPVQPRVLRALQAGGDGVSALAAMVRGPQGSILALRLKSPASAPAPAPALHSPEPSPHATPRVLTPRAVPAYVTAAHPTSQPATPRAARTLFPPASDANSPQTAPDQGQGPAPGSGGEGGGGKVSESALGYWKRREAQAGASSNGAVTPYWQMAPPKPQGSVGGVSAGGAPFRFLF